ncbi:hypothetical protein SLE2022_023290 [Rubroshorea leprosula]
MASSAEQVVALKNLCESDDKIGVGIKVCSEEEAYCLYNKYALNRGFSIRKGIMHHVNGVLQQQEYICSKEEFRRNEDSCNVKKINNLDTRTRCKARIRFTITNEMEFGKLLTSMICTTMSL